MGPFASIAALAGASLVAAVVGAALTGPPALAKSAAGTVEVRGDTIIFRAGDGASNYLTIGDDKDGHISLSEGPPDLNAITSKDCKEDPDQSTSVTCDGRLISRIVVYLGDKDDTLFTDVPWWMPTAAYTVYGGPGDDVARGGEGDDTIFGSYGADKLYGGNGTDTILGNQGPDFLSGADTDYKDLLFGGPGHDTAVRNAEDVVVGVETIR